jgi:thioredoxin 1
MNPDFYPLTFNNPLGTIGAIYPKEFIIVRFIDLKDSISQELTMNDIHHVTEDTFQNEVLGASQPVLVDFTAVWCGPCKMLEPVVKELATDWEGQARVVKLDVDTNASIAMQYQVMGVPTLMLFVDGEPKERLTGYQPKKRIEKKFSPYIP